MTALGRYLSRDRAAAALVAAAVAAAPSPAAARGPTLAVLVKQDAGIARAASALKDSAGRCLRHQATMIAAVAAAGPPPGTPVPEGKSPARAAVEDPVGLRQAQLMLYLVNDPMQAVAEALEGSVPPPEVQADMEAHARLRRACIAWSDRSLAMVKQVLKGPVGPELEARVAKLRETAARDDRRIKAVAAEKRPLSEAEVAAMETNLPSP